MISLTPTIAVVAPIPAIASAPASAPPPTPAADVWDFITRMLQRRGDVPAELRARFLVDLEQWRRDYELLVLLELLD